MKSPFTGKEMILTKEKGIELEFRKEKFEIVYHSYLCPNTGERLTTEELDRINLSQVHNQYRVKYGIPFPEEIRKIREQYDVSASKMSEILGLGANSYRLYESGEIPSISNGRLILGVKDPKYFIDQVKASEHLLTVKEKNKIIEKAQQLALSRSANQWDLLYEKHLFPFDFANEYSGYKKADLDLISNVIEYLYEHIDTLYKTKLNKLLFYIDFRMFQVSGFSITGLTYRAIQFGPVPAEYDKLYNKLQEDNRISIIQIPSLDGNYCEAIKANHKTNRSLFSNEEVNVMDKIIYTIGDLSSSKLVDLSHKENAWKENYMNKGLINYAKYAFDLSMID